MVNAAKKSAEPAVHDPAKLPGRLKLIGGSMSDDWNNIIANQVVSALWLQNSDAEQVKEQRYAAVDALVGIAPRDELEGMIAAQLVACHNASMECYRRAMMRRAVFRGTPGEFKPSQQALSHLCGFARCAQWPPRQGPSRRSPWSTSTCILAAQAVVGNGRDPGGWGSHRNQRINPMQSKLPMHLSRRCGARTGAGAGASRRRCRTADAGCTAERHRAHRREIRTPSSTGAIRQTPLLDAEPSPC